MFSLGEFMALVIVTSLLFSSFIYPSLLATFGDLAWEYRYVPSYMLVVAMLWHDSVPINITYAWITLGTRSDDVFFFDVDGFFFTHGQYDPNDLNDPMCVHVSRF